MTKIIYPIFEGGDNYFKVTRHRFFSVFSPIQKTKDKESDFVAYLATPVIDAFILEPLYTLEVVIHLLNAIASISKAFYVWSIKQQTTKSLIDEKTSKEVGDAVSEMGHALSGIVAQTCNALLSVLSLITRPLVSILHAVTYDEPSSQQENQSSYSPAVYPS